MWNISDYLASMMTNDARCTREIKRRIVTAKAAYFSFRVQIGLKFKDETHKTLLLKKLCVVLKLRYFGT
jgi:hypothetical protein